MTYGLRQPVLKVGFLLGLTLLPAFVSQGAESANPPVTSAQPVSGIGGDKILKRISKLEMYPCDDCHSTPGD